MYMQRLKADREIGFNYDYMGHAEFENGATLNGRLALVELSQKGEAKAVRTKLYAKFRGSRSGPIDVVVIGRADFISTIGKEFTITAEKTDMHFQDPRFLAWMSVWWEGVNGEPLLILRNDPDVLKRIDPFIDNVIDQIKEVETAK